MARPFHATLPSKPDQTSPTSVAVPSHPSSYIFALEPIANPIRPNSGQ